jgi:hypothetical protein
MAERLGQTIWPSRQPTFPEAGEVAYTSEEVVGLDRDHFGLHYETGRWMVEWSDQPS